MQLEANKPDQFCIMLNISGSCASVAPFPVAWRMELVHDKRWPGEEYVR